MSTHEGRKWLAPMRGERDRITDLLERNGVKVYSASAMPLRIWFTPIDMHGVDVPPGMSDEELVAWGKGQGEP